MIKVDRYPLLRRAMLRWFLLRRGMTLGVRVAAFDEEGRVCLVRHTYLDGWHLPGGGIERGEHAELAAERELREEAGAEPVGQLVLHGVFHNAPLAARNHILVYVARPVRIVATRPPDWEIAETGFFAPDALPEGITRGARERLGEILDGTPPPPRW